jgi:hypothetical protein
MAKFESPLGAKPISSPQMREFTVPDESGYSPPQQRPRDTSVPIFDDTAFQEFAAQMQTQAPMRQAQPSELEQQFAEAKRLKREGKERLSDGAKRRIEMLIGMTRLTRDVEIGGHVYRLKTLSSKDLREALSIASNFADSNVLFIFETRKQILARSITIVAGVDIDQFLNSNELTDRLAFIDELDHTLLIRLYNEYNIMAKESQDKYVLKTEEEVQEVLTDLKK